MNNWKEHASPRMLATYEAWIDEIAKTVYAHSEDYPWLYGTENLYGFVKELYGDHGIYHYFDRGDAREVEVTMLKLYNEHYSSTEDDYYNIPM